MTTSLPMADFDPDLPLSRARTIPNSWYTSPAIYELERDAVFAQSWQMVGRADQVKEPGAYLTANIAGEPILIVRGEDGVLRGMFNVCRHRAAPILNEECGHVTKLRCRYHGWTYDLAGRLKGTPEFDGVEEFNKEEQGLPPVAVAEWGPFIFVRISEGKDVSYPIMGGTGVLAGAESGSGGDLQLGGTGVLAGAEGRSGGDLQLGGTGVLAGASAVGGTGVLAGADSHSLLKVTKQSYEPIRTETFTRRNLPHIQKPGASYHLIFRTEGGLILSHEARIEVLSACRFWDRKKMHLHAAVVMPDHVHLLLTPSTIQADTAATSTSLAELLHSIKGYSAKQVNRIMGRRGTVWMPERYDRYLRSEDDFEEKYEYIANNPIKDGLVSGRGEYPHIYLEYESASATRTGEDAGATHARTGEDAGATQDKTPRTGEDACATQNKTPRTGEDAGATQNKTPRTGEDACATQNKTPRTGEDAGATRGLASYLKPLPEWIASRGGFGNLMWQARKTYDLNCNWKVYVDNYLDGGYHVNTVHPGLAGVLDYHEYHTVCDGRTVLQSSPMKPAEGPASRTRTGDLAAYWWLWPNFMLNFYSGIMDTNLVLPLGADRCRVIFDFYFAHGTDLSFIADSVAFADQVQAEDTGICEDVQRGLNSRSYTTGRFSVKRENGGHWFHRMLAKALTG